MAVTTTYEFDPLQLLDITQGAGAAQSDVEALGLDGGGFAAGGHSGTSAALDVFSPSITDTGGNVLFGNALAMDQLSNGKIIAVTAFPTSSDLLFILDSVNGAANFSAATSNSLTNFDVAALSGDGFWIASEATDIVVVRYNNAGAEVGTFTITDGGAQLRSPRIAGLDGGNIAVAYERRVAVDSVQIHYAIYDPTGAFVAGLTAVDALGAVNEAPSITALDSGGFAIVYESDREGNGTVDTILTVFDAAGVRQGVYNVSNPGLDDDGSNDLNPTVTQMANGLIAIAWDNTLFDSDTFISLVDPTTGAILASTFITGGENINDFTGSASLADAGLGQLAAYHTNTTDSDIDGELLQAVRNSTGDGADDTMTGDDFVDVMSGNGGADTLNGAAGNDVLDGGSGTDTLNGGTGADAMTGGDGNDVYVVDNIADTVTETNADKTIGGYDTVLSSVTYTIGANIESLQLIGTGDIIATANDLNNYIAGNSGDNRLNGRGGIDTMIGGDGDDVYVIGVTGDNGTETNAAVAGGYDTLWSFITITAGANFESIQLQGGAVINATGNALSNYITGNSVANVLAGGQGFDQLMGNGGNDTFAFGGLASSTAVLAGADRILDFTTGDKISVSAIDANTGIGGDQAFVLDAGGAFSAGEYRVIDIGADLQVEFNVDGGATDLVIRVMNTVSLANSDFIL